jgi:hypothetical protein
VLFERGEVQGDVENVLLFTFLEESGKRKKHCMMVHVWSTMI